MKNTQKKSMAEKLDTRIKKLTPTETAFVEEYISNRGNATQAMLKVYSDKKGKISYTSAAEKSCKLLKKDNVAHAVEVRRKEILDELKKNTLKQVQDLEEIKGRCMTAKPVMAWDNEEKKQVQKTEKILDKKTGEEKIVGVYEFDSKGAISATAEQNKMLGMYADTKPDVEVNVSPVVGVKIQVVERKKYDEKSTIETTAS